MCFRMRGTLLASVLCLPEVPDAVTSLFLLFPCVAILVKQGAASEETVRGFLR